MKCMEMTYYLLMVGSSDFYGSRSYFITIDENDLLWINPNHPDYEIVWLIVVFVVECPTFGLPQEARAGGGRLLTP